MTTGATVDFPELPAFSESPRRPQPMPVMEGRQECLPLLQGRQECLPPLQGRQECLPPLQGRQECLPYGTRLVIGRMHMKCGRLITVVLLLAVLTGTASAGIFGKKNKPTPQERVPELITTIKTDGDEHKRTSAAEELRQYDPKQFPNIVPALIDALTTDAKPSVRAEAAQSLSKMRPVTKEAGWALEQAVSKDSSMRVRLQARSALLHYHLAGYHSGKDPAPMAVPPQSNEPPLAAPPAKPAVTLTPPPPPVQAMPVSQSAKPKSAAPAAGSGNAPQPLPAGPLVPTETPKLKPTPTSGDQGPELD
jgi:hypothetical protein